MKKALATGTMALLLVGVGTSCSSTRAPEPPWSTWAKPAGPADSGGASYDARTLAQKWRELEALDAASPALGVEPGTFRAIRSETAAPRILDRMRMRRSLLEEALAREDSPLLELLANDHTLAARHREAMRTYDDALIQAQLVLYRNTHPAPEATRSAQPGRFGRWWDHVGARMGRDAYSMQGFVFTKVARIKSPRAHLLVFTSDDVGELRSLLQPGDLILTFTDGYVGNLFLPGVFKHGIIYVGSPEERTAADRSPDQTDWGATLVTGPEARAALRQLMSGSVSHPAESRGESEGWAPFLAPATDIRSDSVGTRAFGEPRCPSRRCRFAISQGS